MNSLSKGFVKLLENMFFFWYVYCILYIYIYRYYQAHKSRGLQELVMPCVCGISYGPGYRVWLRLGGKYRRVEWRKLSSPVPQATDSIEVW